MDPPFVKNQLILVNFNDNFEFTKVNLVFDKNLRVHSQTTWTERHTYMVRKMSTNVHVGYLDGPPSVNVDMIFLLNSSNIHKIVLLKHKTLFSIMFESIYWFA